MNAAADTAAVEPLHVAYLVNQYPMVSHSFIRREILALERHGVRVQRIALRGWTGPLAGADDLQERERTQHVLAGGTAALIAGLARMVVSRPGLSLSVLGQALRMSRGSDRSLPYHLVYFAEACVAAHWIERSGARHLHAHFGTNSAEVALLAARLASIGFSFTVHGPEEFDRPRCLGLAEKIARSDFVVAISSFGRSQLLRWTAFAQWPKVHVVHCGIDRSFRGADATSAVSAPAPRRLVCVGRICEQKGQLLLLSAMRRVLDRGADFELVLAGDGEMRAEIETLVDRLGLRSSVRITGWISGQQVREEILGARALVLVLVGVQDPGNVGTLLRSAEAFGATGAVACRGTAHPLSPKALRASAGSALRLPLLAAAEDASVLARLREAKLRIFAATIDGGESPGELDFCVPCALLVGNESSGLPAAMASAADQRVRITLAEGVESLNAGVAGAVLLYEAARQRNAKLSAGMPGQSP